MLNHTIITGILPEDAEELIGQLDQFSAQGFVTVSTTESVIDASKFRYTVLMGKPMAAPAHQRAGISMSGGGPRQKVPPNVDPNTPPQSEGPPGS